MNSFMKAMKKTTNYVTTENGATTHKSTLSDLLDLFALGGAYRNRSDDDVKLLVRNAYLENPVYTLKCLFYLRDIRGGQGERRFFRVAIKDLISVDKEAVRRNMIHIPEFGRWDDLYAFVDTPLQNDALMIIKNQFKLDLQCETPSLLAKWMKSENTSSEESKRLGNITRKYLGMSHKEYRQALSMLRTKINVLEKLMSERRWDEIEFDKIPSVAGLRYKNAFARHDIERMKMMAMQSYEEFAKDTSTKVNAATLNPVNIAEEILRTSKYSVKEIDRLMWQKYWDNLTDYYNGREENGLAIVDVSGSMFGTPLYAAISMGAYIAERGHGPFTNHFITFSCNPKLVKFEGADIYDKFHKARSADWGMNTNIQAVFEMMLRVAIVNKVPVSDMPQTLYIFSDMEFDGALSDDNHYLHGSQEIETLLENIANTWKKYGYELPRVIFWNLDARHDNIPALNGRFSYISGFNMNMVEQVLSGCDGYDLMMNKLNEPRYECIH